MKLKKLTSLFISFTLAISISGVAGASNYSTVENLVERDGEQSTISVPGYTVSRENIQGVLGSGAEKYTDYIAEEKLVHRTDLLINNLTLDGDNVNVNGSVKYNDTEIPLQLDGNLYSSREQSDGVNSYVGDLKEINGNFNVLLFKVKTNDKADTSLISEDLRNKANFKLYLQDNKGDIWYYEEELSVLGIDTSKIITDGSNTDSLKDGNWFEQILNPSAMEIIPYENFTTYSTHSYFRACDSLYYSKVPFGIDVAEFYFCPSVEGDIVDVGKAGSANWTSRLTVAEHVRVNGTETTGLEQRYKLGGVGTQTIGTIAAGQNTKITSRLIGGTYKKSTSEIKVNWSVITGLFTKSIPYYATGKTALDVLTSITYNTTTTTVSNNTYENVVGNVSGFSYKIDKDGYLYDAAHYLDLGVMVSTWDSTKTKNESTTAYVNWKFDVSFLGAKQGSTVDWKIPVTYKTNVQ